LGRSQRQTLPRPNGIHHQRPSSRAWSL
jgi:hypothetical protein